MSATAYPGLKSSDAWPPFTETQTWVDWQQPQVCLAARAGQEGPETYSRVKEPSCLQGKGPIPDGPEMQPLSFLLQPQLSEGGPQDYASSAWGKGPDVPVTAASSPLPVMPPQKGTQAERQQGPWPQ